jgi:hypothetical protein
MLQTAPMPVVPFISHEVAQAKAELEYDKFKSLTAATDRPVDADFEKAAKQIQKLHRPKKSKKNKG